METATRERTAQRSASLLRMGEAVHNVGEKVYRVSEKNGHEKVVWTFMASDGAGKEAAGTL